VNRPSSAYVRRWTIIVIPTLAFLVLGWVWAFASPVGSSADEAYHLTSIWCAWGDSESCQHTPTVGVVKVPDRIANASCMAQLGNESAACVYSLTHETTQSVTVNVGNYPPVYYLVMRAFVGHDITKAVLLMRFVNVAIAAGLIAFALAVARPVALRAMALALMACLVPTGVFFISSVNPSSWAITGGMVFWAFFYTLLTERTLRSRRSIAAATGALASAVLAMSARGDSAVVLTASALAVVLLAWPHLRRRMRRLWLLLLAIPLVIVAALFNVGRYAKLDLVFPAGNPEWDQPNAVLKLVLEMPSFLAGILGGQSPDWSQRASSVDSQMPGFSWPGYAYGVGALDVQNPEISGLLVLACVGGVIFLGFRSHGIRKIIALGLLAATLVVELVYMRGLVAFQPIQSPQPRYYFALVVVIVSVAAIAFPLRPSLVNRGQALLLVGLLTVADIAALMATVARYTYGQAHSWTGITDPPSWWWSYGPSPAVTISLGALATVIWLLGMAHIAVQAGSATPSPAKVSAPVV
jgi:hypothetical protein